MDEKDRLEEILFIILLFEPIVCGRSGDCPVQKLATKTGDLSMVDGDPIAPRNVVAVEVEVLADREDVVAHWRIIERVIFIVVNKKKLFMSTVVSLEEIYDGFAIKSCDTTLV